jgi:histidyl-tRNA synthetase
MRDQGFRVDYSLTPTKVGKQFQMAEQLGARYAVVFGDEWPNVAVKDLRSGEQKVIPQEQLVMNLPR